MVYYRRRNRRFQKPRTGPRRPGYRWSRSKGKIVPRSRVPRSFGYAPLGRMHACKMRYATQIELNPAAGVAVSYPFSCNNMFYPDTLTGTHQPYGYDQMAVLYNKYTVVGARMWVMPFVPSSGLAGWCGIQQSTSGTPLSTTTMIVREQPGTNLKLIGTSGANMPNRSTVSNSWSARKFFGRKRGNIVNEESLTGTTNGSALPAEQAYFHFIFAPNYTGDDLPNSAFQITIDYYIVFTDPVIVGPSN